MRICGILCVLFLSASTGRANTIYQYTGSTLSFVFGDWQSQFGKTPSHITATVEFATPLGAWEEAGNLFAWQTPFGSPVVSASITDGVRTFIPGVVYLSTDSEGGIFNWRIAGGYFPLAQSSDEFALTTNNIWGGYTPGSFEYSQDASVSGDIFDGTYNAELFYASGPADGYWTSHDSSPPPAPEIDSAAAASAIALLICAILLRRGGSARQLH